MMIVKVQLSQASSDGEKHMLIYNKDRSALFEGIATKEVVELMRDKPKLFFEAELVNKEFVIKNEVKFQNW